MNDTGAILVVDDRSSSFGAIVDVLSKAGYLVRTAPDGAAALAAAIVDPPDMVLAPFQMPGLDGPTFCQRLQERQETRGIPVILYSASASAAEWLQGLRAGAADCVALPLDSARLLARVETQLGLRHGNRTAPLQRDETVGDDALLALIEGLPDVVMRFDRAGRHLFVSQNVRELVDLPADQFLGKTHRELGFPEEQCRFWEQAIRQVFDSAQPYQVEYAFEGPRGDKVLDCRLVPELGPRGTVRTVIFISRDVTAQRKTERDYKSLFERMLSGFALHEIICDEQGQAADYRFLTVNPAFEQITGLEGQQIVGRTVREVLPGVEPHWIETYGRVALTGEPVTFEQYSHNLDKHFQVTAFRPAPNQFAAIFADITDHKRSGEALRLTETALREAQAIAGVGSYVLDIPSGVWRSSAVLDDLVGIDAQYPHTLGGWLDLVAPDQRLVMANSYYVDLIKRQQPCDEQYQVIRQSDGALRWVHQLGELELDKDGAPLRLVGTVMDITERKRAEAYQQLSVDVLGMLNWPSGLYEALNDVLTAVKTTTGADAVGIRLQSGEDYPYIAESGLGDAFLSAENSLVERNQRGDICRHADGTPTLECACGLVISGKADLTSPLFTPGGSFWTNNSATLLEMPVADDPRYHPRNRCIHEGYASMAIIPIRARRNIVGLLHLNGRAPGLFTLDIIQRLEDIAAHIGEALLRKQDEAQLRDNALFVEALIEAIPAPMFYRDVFGRFLGCNQAYADFQGLAKSEIVGRTVYEALPRELAEQLIASDKRLLADQGSGISVNHVVVTRADGQRRDVVSNAARFYDGAGVVRGVVGVGLDITDRVRMEDELRRTADDLERSNKDLEQFAYVASHDLQEPLRMVTSYTQLLARRYHGRLDADADDYIAFALDGAQRMHLLIADLLAYARVGTQGKPLAPTDSGAVVDLACAALGTAIEQNGAQITRDELPLVMADDRQLAGVFQNLIGNGMKFTRAGETPRVHISASRAPGERDADIWTFAVRDNGIGIPADQADNIFVIFRRLHTRDEYPGTGIGLAICKQVIERLGGRIWVKSTVGEGSTFYFTLQAAPSAGDPD